MRGEAAVGGEHSRQFGPLLPFLRLETDAAEVAAVLSIGEAGRERSLEVSALHIEAQVVFFARLEAHAPVAGVGEHSTSPRFHVADAQLHGVGRVGVQRRGRCHNLVCDIAEQSFHLPSLHLFLFQVPGHGPVAMVAMLVVGTIDRHGATVFVGHRRG